MKNPKTYDFKQTHQQLSTYHGYFAEPYNWVHMSQEKFIYEWLGMALRAVINWASFGYWCKPKQFSFTHMPDGSTLVIKGWITYDLSVTFKLDKHGNLIAPMYTVRFLREAAFTLLNELCPQD